MRVWVLLGIGFGVWVSGPGTGTGLAEAEERKVAVFVAWGMTTDFQARSGMAEALGRENAEEAAVVIRQMFEEPAGDAEGIALRRMVLGGLAKNTAGWVEAIAERASLDRDPGVRIAAVPVLFGRDHGTLMRLATDDEWPEVRKPALGALAESVDPVAQAFVLGVAWSREQTYELREFAVGLLGNGNGNEDIVAAMIEGFGRIEEEALVTDKAHGLMRRVIAVLGRSKDARALPLLLRVGESFPAPRVRAEAVLALGAQCTKEARRVIDGAKKSSEREVELAGRKAAAICAAAR